MGIEFTWQMTDHTNAASAFEVMESNLGLIGHGVIPTTRRSSSFWYVSPRVDVTFSGALDARCLEVELIDTVTRAKLGDASLQMQTRPRDYIVADDYGHVTLGGDVYEAVSDAREGLIIKILVRDGVPEATAVVDRYVHRGCFRYRGTVESGRALDAMCIYLAFLSWHADAHFDECVEDGVECLRPRLFGGFDVDRWFRRLVRRCPC